MMAFALLADICYAVADCLITVSVNECTVHGSHAVALLSLLSVFLRARAFARSLRQCSSYAMRVLSRRSSLRSRYRPPRPRCVVVVGGKRSANRRWDSR